MDLLKEARNVVDFATYYPLLNKATIDNDTPTPGYLFEDIIKLSHQSQGHRHHLVDFLIARLQISSWPGKQKVVRILHQICSRGHRGVRVYLRGKDGDLRKAAASGGPPDPVLANTPQLFLSSAIQELLTLLFDPKIMKEDELWLAGNENVNEYVAGGEKPSVPQGYGSSAVSGKYEGFGSSPVKQGDSLVTQVRGMVERVITHTGESKGVSVDFLQGEKGDYQPIFLPSLGASVPSPQQPLHQSHLPGLTSGQLRKFKAHRSGRAGGGWDSDEEGQDTPPSPLSSNVDFSLPLPEQHSTEEIVAGAAEEEYIMKILYSASWPADPDRLIISCRESASFDLNVFFEKVTAKFAELCDVGTRSSDSAEDKPRDIDTPTQSTDITSSCEPDKVTVQLLMLLLLIEFGIHYDIYSPNIANTHLRKTFQTISTSKNLDSRVQIKAKKLRLILEKLQ
ncbi:AP-4 complex accessory subunit Tepsin-like isoform X1 [Penaeus indicus]|uniref:AP-4 complex accessory subunit Tepsin-like isoform X1 n=1 Tax=Penaeus indicus TaxID=29960 RepID=UPI00300DB55E